MTIYYSADLHLGHKNIIRLCNRPFFSVEEMDREIISRWNTTVSNDDTVYLLGDFSWAKGEKLRNYFDALKGNKHIILGNHDIHFDDHGNMSQTDVLRLPWKSISTYKEIRDSGKHVILFHYGIRSWNGMYRDSISLYGHSHGKLAGNSRSLDVGVDCWDYTPVNLPKILARMETLEPVTFHEKNARDEEAKNVNS